MYYYKYTLQGNAFDVTNNFQIIHVSVSALMLPQAQQLTLPCGVTRPTPKFHRIITKDKLPTGRTHRKLRLRWPRKYSPSRDRLQTFDTRQFGRMIWEAELTRHSPRVRRGTGRGYGGYLQGCWPGYSLCGCGICIQFREVGKKKAFVGTQGLLSTIQTPDWSRPFLVWRFGTTNKLA